MVYDARMFVGVAAVITQVAGKLQTLKNMYFFNAAFIMRYDFVVHNNDGLHFNGASPNVLTTENRNTL